MNRLLNYTVNLYQVYFSSDPQKRLRAARFFTRHFARRSNIQLYNHNLIWSADVEYLAIWAKFRETTSTIRDKQYHVFQLSSMVKDLPGDTVECGVFRGATSFLICMANQGKENYTHHVFDSFQGLSEPGSEDRKYAIDQKRMAVTLDDVQRYKAHDWNADFADVKQNLADFVCVNFYPGWIPERFEDIADRQFAFVHVDVDLYQPTIDSLTFFYDRVSAGGIILCDDYGYADTPGAKKAMDEFLADKPERCVHLTTGQAFFIKHA